MLLNTFPLLAVDILNKELHNIGHVFGAANPTKRQWDCQFEGILRVKNKPKQMYYCDFKKGVAS